MITFNQYSKSNFFTIQSFFHYYFYASTGLTFKSSFINKMNGIKKVLYFENRHRLGPTKNGHNFRKAQSKQTISYIKVVHLLKNNSVSLEVIYSWNKVNFVSANYKLHNQPDFFDVRLNLVFAQSKWWQGIWLMLHKDY